MACFFCLRKRPQQRRLARRAEEWLKDPKPRVRVRPNYGKVSQQAATKTNSRLSYRAKLNICRQCEHVKYLLGRCRCDLCGCFMELKAALPSSECPAQKW
ncbi:MAG: DUF6171 family protein [bacterium]